MEFCYEVKRLFYEDVIKKMCGHREERDAHDIWEYVRESVKESEVLGEDIYSFYIPERDIREHVTRMLEKFNYKVINSDDRRTIYVEIK